MTPPCALANVAWAASQVRSWASFRRALCAPAPAQRLLLARTLARNAKSEFGRRHDFAQLRSVREFQRRVPPCTWDDLAADVQRVAGGAAGVLTHEPVRNLAWTSGSTGGAKHIPFTRELLREFQRAIGPWITEMYRTRPALLGGPAYWSVTPPAVGAAQGDGPVPVGFEEDTEYLGGWTKRLVDRALAVPGSIREERDVERFRHLTALFLLRTPQLRLVSVWHPSFLTLLLDAIERDWEALLRDVHDGLRAAPWARLRPGDTRRARTLEAAGPGELGRVWPRLRLVSAWASGHAALGAAELACRLPGVELQAKGLVATEAFVSLPFAGRHPLAIRSHFFEFERSPGDFCLAHELERGEEAAVLVTTGGGLYRYRLGDRVRVDDFVERTPSLTFVGRTDARSDLRGEKLDEVFVTAVIDELLRETGTAARFAMLRPELPSEGAPRYCLQLESPTAQLAPLAQRLEALLSRNPHYAHCVRLGQLAPSRVVAVEAGFERYAEERLRRGQRLGDVKPPALDLSPAPR